MAKDAGRAGGRCLCSKVGGLGTGRGSGASSPTSCFTVRTRAGYYGLTDEKPDEKPVGPTAERNRMNKALVSPFAANEMEVRLTSLFAADPVRGSLLRNARLQLGSALTPGEYVIQIVVEDHVARRTATQVMPFEVIK